jgi:hypothetical protein
MVVLAIVNNWDKIFILNFVEGGFSDNLQIEASSKMTYRSKIMYFQLE